MILSYCCRARATLEDMVGSSGYLGVHHGITIGAILPYFYIADFCTPAINPNSKECWVSISGLGMVVRFLLASKTGMTCCRNLLLGCKAGLMTFEPYYSGFVVKDDFLPPAQGTQESMELG